MPEGNAGGGPRGIRASATAEQRKAKKEKAFRTGHRLRSEPFSQYGYRLLVTASADNKRVRFLAPRDIHAERVARWMARTVTSRLASELAPIGPADFSGRVSVTVESTTAPGAQFAKKVNALLLAILKDRAATSKPPDDRPADTPGTVRSFDEIVGPFYDSAGVALRLRVPNGTVQEQAGLHKLLGCLTAEGTLVFPTFQFGDGDLPLDGLANVLATMAEGTRDSWQVALWLRTPSKQLKGQSPHAMLVEGNVEAVERLAQQTAARWRN